MKKQIKSFTLSDRAIKQLQAIADYNGLSMSAQIQVLIGREYREVLRDKKKSK